jgi:NAD(P)-dependent dehydrogenase (short-subunit alcohol dehydrogenase family)
MTPAPDAQRPPEQDDQAGSGSAGGEVPVPQTEFLQAPKQLMRGSRALIVGGAAGIGRVIALGLAREGVDVAIVYAPDEPVEDATQTAALVEQEGRRCITMRGDLSDEDTCQQAVDQTVAELGGIDMLIDVTAIQSGFSDLAALDDDRWERSFRTNLFSFFMATRRPLPGGRKRRGRRRPFTNNLLLKDW